MNSQFMRWDYKLIFAHVLKLLKDVVKQLNLQTQSTAIKNEQF